jgi:hypothetical protein
MKDLSISAHDLSKEYHPGNGKTSLPRGLKNAQKFS